MRLAIAVVLFLLSSVPAIAQTFEPDTVYSPPPPTFPLPDVTSLESVIAARGNLAAWRDQERERLGPFLSDGVAASERGLPEVGGYFAILPGGMGLPGIVQGTWRHPDSAVGQRMVMSGLRYIRPYQVCGAVRATEAVDIDQLVYLGSNWSDVLEALDTQIEPERTRGGEQLSETPPLPFTARPSARDFSRYYPMRAFMASVAGEAALNCLIGEGGALRCGVVSESPEGYDFGAAARRIIESPSVRVETVRDGVSTVGQCTRRRIQFRTG